MNSLPKRLVAARGERTQAKFAALLGVELRTLRSWEQGSRRPRDLAAKHLEQLLQRIEQETKVRKPRT